MSNFGVCTIRAGCEVWCLSDRYEGETCEGQFHGQGVAYFEGGHVYKVQLYK